MSEELRQLLLLHAQAAREYAVLLQELAAALEAVAWESASPEAGDGHALQ